MKRRALPKELSAFFKRRIHAQGSRRHWKKRFNCGELIGRETLENADENSREKFTKWADFHGAIYDCGWDGLRKGNLP